MVGRDGADETEKPNLSADVVLMKKLRFRNYRPRDESLQKYCDEVEDVSLVVINTQAEFDATLSTASAKFSSAELDFENIVPKKSNWELKRALKPKLERLERRTERALLELARKAAHRQNVSGQGGDHLARTVAAAELIDFENDE